MLYEVTLVRVVSVVEAYATDLGETAVRLRLGATLRSPPTAAVSRGMVEYLWEQKWASLSSGSWDRLVGLWKDGLDVRFDNFSEYDDVKLLRLTRHAIAHRVGEYTKGYRREARKRLLALGIDPEKAEGLIPLTEDDVRASFVLARGFVAWLDPQVSR